MVELRTAITWRSEELEERQSHLEKREIALDKSKNLNETEKSRCSMSTELGAKRKKDMELTDKVWFSICEHIVMQVDKHWERNFLKNMQQ